jgi:hypothetical protein
MIIVFANIEAFYYVCAGKDVSYTHAVKIVLMLTGKEKVSFLLILSFLSL